MAGTVPRSFRLDSELFDELATYAKNSGLSNTEAVEAAIRLLLDCTTDCTTRTTECTTCTTECTTDETDWRSLYFSEKDRADKLNDDLAEAFKRNQATTEKLADDVRALTDRLGAAQALHAVDKSALVAPADGVEIEIPERSQKFKWRQRFRILFRGKA